MRDFLSARCKIQLNFCVVLQHPPGREVLHICSGRLWTAGAGRSKHAADLLEVNTETRVKPSAQLAETYLVEIAG